LERFRRVLDQLPAVYRIKLVGLGEPLLNPEFFDLVREARRRRVAVLTTTNGTLFSSERRREALRSGINHLNVSVDAARAETHARLRPGSDLAEIGEGVTALMRERRGNSPRVRVWHVIQRASVPEIPELVDRCAEWGVDGLLCTANLTNFGSTSLESVVGERRVLAEQLQGVLPEARRRAAATGLEFRCPEAPPRPRRPEEGSACKWPWGRVFISAGGEVRPCPYAGGDHGLTLGTLFCGDGGRSRFAAVWNGSEAQALRARVRSAQNPEFCRACYPGWGAETAGGASCAQ
jgi:pyrroloquinoline quinone biosynthesis protein E